MPTVAIRDSIGPIPLAWQQVDLTGLLAAPDSGMKIDTLLGRFLEVREVEKAPRLFYKLFSKSDTWLEINLALPELDDDNWNWRNGHGAISLDTANLDLRGAPEILVTAETSNIGSGSGSSWVYKAVLDITNKPVLLLRALTEVEDELHGDGSANMSADEVDVSCGREVIMLNHEVVIGPVKTDGKRNSPNCSMLTNLPAGHYRYQNGKVLLVK